MSKWEIKKKHDTRRKEKKMSLSFSGHYITWIYECFTCQNVIKSYSSTSGRVSGVSRLWLDQRNGQATKFDMASYRKKVSAVSEVVKFRANKTNYFIIICGSLNCSFYYRTFLFYFIFFVFFLLVVFLLWVNLLVNFFAWLGGFLFSYFYIFSSDWEFKW